MGLGFLSRYRKRKQISLDGTVPGIEYSRYHRGYNASAFDRPIRIASWQPAESYEPDPGPMVVREADYRPYGWETEQLSTPDLRLDPVVRPPVPIELVPTYEDGVRLQEFLDEMQESPQALADPSPSAEDTPSIAIGLEEKVNEAVAADPVTFMVWALEQRAHESMACGDVRDHGTTDSPDSLDDVVAGQTPYDPGDETAMAFGHDLEQIAAQFAAEPPQPEPEPDPQQRQQEMYDEELLMMLQHGMMMGPGPMM